VLYFYFKSENIDVKRETGNNREMKTSLKESQGRILSFFLCFVLGLP